MADKITRQHNDDSAELKPESLKDNQQDTMHQPDRRRLLKIGVLLVPVILTVRSRPIFAQAGGSSIEYGGYQTDQVQNKNNTTPTKKW